MCIYTTRWQQSIALPSAMSMLGLVEAVSSIEVMALVFSDMLFSPPAWEDDGCTPWRHSDVSEMLSQVSTSPASNGTPFSLPEYPGYEGGFCSSECCVPPRPAGGRSLGGWQYVPLTASSYEGRGTAMPSTTKMFGSRLSSCSSLRRKKNWNTHFFHSIYIIVQLLCIRTLDLGICI